MIKVRRLFCVEKNLLRTPPDLVRPTYQQLQSHFFGFICVYNLKLNKFLIFAGNISLWIENSCDILSRERLTKQRNLLIDYMYNLESIPIIEYDNFLKSKFITWSSVGGRTESFPQYNFGDSIICYFDNKRLSFIFTFRFYDNKTYLVLKFKPKEYKLKVNDSVNFLFENETLLNFAVTNEPYKAGTYSDSGAGFPDYYETLIPISLRDIELFAKCRLNNYAVNLKSYKLVGGNNKVGKFWLALTFYSSVSINDNIFKKETFQKALMLFASTFLKLIKREVPDYIETIESISNETCYVYLMHDLMNNFYKIGISNSPVYREKTLQSEKPTILLIRSKRFPKRKIAEILEKTLHSTYSNKRIRGEWFSLDTDDINDISQILNE